MKKENGDDYPPNSIYCLCCGLQRSVRNCDVHVNIFTDSEFVKCRQILDSRMKELQASGRFEKQSADFITEEMEDRLWELQILGDHTPQVLLDTVFYYVGLYFALRGGDEHRRLRHEPSQIKLYEPPCGLKYLVYTEDVSKTNQGGLNHRNRIPKKVTL